MLNHFSKFHTFAAQAAQHAPPLGCDHESFFNPHLTSDQLCHLAKTECGDQYDFVNFFMICYCWLSGNWMLSLLLSFILILLIFKFISAVVEEYLAPSISYISEWLGLSEPMAAVTLLALANGAGDVITALVASGSEDGLSYNIGSIYGAGLFVTSIVVAMTIMNAKEYIKLEPMTIKRDVGMYILATLSIITFGFMGELSVVSASVMLAEYALLVLIVYIQDRSKANEKENEDEEEPQSGANSPQVEPLDIMKLPNDKTEEEKKASGNKWKNILSKKNTASPDDRLRLLLTNFKSTVLVMIKMHKKKESRENTFEEKSAWDKFNHIIDLPFDYARKITLPPCEEEKYEKMWALIFPIPGLLFLFFAATLKPAWWFLYVALPLGGLMMLVIWKTSPEKQIPKYYILLEILGTIGALMWTYLVSGILIDILQFLGMLSKLNKTYLALTVIAVGNALPDAVTTIALAKQGYAMMGLTGAYAGQLFGLLVGFGMALLRKTIQDGNQTFDIFNKQKLDENMMIIIVIFVALLVLVVTFVYGIIKKYKFTKQLAQVLGAIYIIFLIVTTVISVKKALS